MQSDYFKMHFFIFWGWIWLFSTSVAMGQGYSMPYIDLECKYYFSYWSDHGHVMDYVIESPPSVFDLQYTIRRNNRPWKQYYKVAPIGLGFSYANFGNPDVLGKAYAIYYVFDYPIIQQARFQLDFRFRQGFAYLTKKFDPVDNYFNLSIGSNINAYLAPAFNLKIQLLPYLLWDNSLGLAHFSNSAAAVPNIGFNLLAYQTGLSYRIDYSNKNVDEPKLRDYKKNLFSVSVSFGRKEILLATDKKYLVSILTLRYERRVSYKRRLGIGIDCMDNPSLIAFNTAKHKDTNTFTRYSVGLNLSHSWVFDTVSFTAQQGFYLYNTGYPEKRYNRFSVRYDFVKHGFLRLSVKTHALNADYVDLGLGYQIGK